MVCDDRLAADLDIGQTKLGCILLSDQVEVGPEGIVVCPVVDDAIQLGRSVVTRHRDRWLRLFGHALLHRSDLHCDWRGVQPHAGLVGWDETELGPDSIAPVALGVALLDRDFNASVVVPESGHADFGVAI